MSTRRRHDRLHGVHQDDWSPAPAAKQQIAPERYIITLTTSVTNTNPPFWINFIADAYSCFVFWPFLPRPDQGSFNDCVRRALMRWS